jgi:hypothetical protein
MPRDLTAAPRAAAVVSHNGLTSSGVDISKRLKDGKRVKITTQGWQAEAWRFYDIIGEFRYAASWVGNLISKASLFPTKNGEITTDTLAVQAIKELYGGPEGQAEMLRKLGVHLTVAGEGYVVAFDDTSSADWEVFDASAIQRAGAGVRIGGSDYDDILVVRIWRPHPRDVKAADAPSRAVLPVLSELETLTKRVAAQSDSRLTGNGILFIPSEITFPGAPTTLNVGDPPNAYSSIQQNADSVAQLLMRVAEKAIEDPTSAAAMLPLIFQAPGEYIDKVNHVTFSSEFDEQLPELRAEAIKRVALGMDMPPEVLLGTADMNHWNAWQLEEAAIKAHTEPFLQMIVDALSEGYLRPWLEANDVDDEEAALYGIGADTAKLRLRPNRSKEAIELYDRAELSGEALLRENGFDPADKMADKERIQWFLRKVASGSTTPELVDAALKAIGAQLEAAPSPAPTTEERPTPSLEEHPLTGPPQVPAQSDGVSASAVAAAEILVYRALERAGNRLKNKLGRARPDCPAADMYLYVPRRSPAEVEELLEDAWSCVDRFDVGIPTTLLASELNTYTAMLIADRRAHDRTLLADYLGYRQLAVSA